MIIIVLTFCKKITIIVKNYKKIEEGYGKRGAKKDIGQKMGNVQGNEKGSGFIFICYFDSCEY